MCRDFGDGLKRYAVFITYGNTTKEGNSQILIVDLQVFK
jgi:hypothetical protein